MTDPLRPFADVIRALWQTRIGRARKGGNETSRARATTHAEGTTHTASGRNDEILRSRLEARIATLDAGNPRKLRETFIETVLLSELGEQLAADPAFADLVLRVSEQLESDRQTGERLHRLLLDIGGLDARPSRD